MIGIAENSNQVNRIIDIIMRKNLNLLSLYLKFVNFSENILILETNAKDSKTVMINNISGISIKLAIVLLELKVVINGIEINTKQFAGVGKPIKFSF